MRLLSSFAAALVYRFPAEYERALARYVDHDARLVHDGPVRERFLATVRGLRAAVAARPDEADRRLGGDAAVRAALDEALARLEAGLPRQEASFQAVGLPPELVTLLAWRLAVFRPAYLAFVAGLPRRAGGEGLARVTAGPDGWFYPDEDFLVRGARPLGRTLPEAIESFERDPILACLQRRGGLDDALAAWDRVPREERPLADLRPYVARHATVSAAAADVIFGDEDLALRLAKALTEG